MKGPCPRGATLVAMIVSLAACSSVAGGDPSVAGGNETPGMQGLSYEDAVASARDYFGPYAGFIEFVRAEAGTLGDFDKGNGVARAEDPRDRLVWAVFFRGTVPVSCPVTPPGVPPPNCDDMDAEILVVLDYHTGEILYELRTAWP